MCDHCGCRAFVPIAELTAEHERILTLAWSVAEATRTGVRAADATGELVELLDVHVAKEERGLYPLLGDDGDLSVAQRAALEEEHRALREALTTGAAFDRRDYFALAAHIEEEEMELFPSAMFGFDEDRWDELAAIHRDVLVTPAA